MGLCASTDTTINAASNEVEVVEEAASEEDVARMRKKMRKKGRRGSVSAESSSEVDKDFVPPVISKTDEESKHIETILKDVFLFAGLHSDEIHTLIGAMSQVNVASGESIIKQGDQGDYFYVVDRGEFDVFVDGMVDENGAPKSVFHYKTGGSFGELALMYNAPRAATVRASTNVKVWSLDQSVFRSIVVGSAARRMDQQIEFLRKVKGKC